MSISGILSKLNSDGHVAVGVFVFIVGSVMHYFHGIDAAFVSFTTTVFAFLGGHSWVQSQKSGGDAGTTGVSNDNPK
jgi:hypothetical protein